ncbi:MAG: methionyl-tRNA formyltransferase [Lachnospiraceae bacterium]|nr:methionyl-tRNA formyltransferase [Lachnospiraceae bacterium]
MRIIFMGTPDYAAAALKAIHEAGHEIALVVTKPDKPVGRGGKVVFSAVKTLALELELPVFQPKRIRDPEAVERLREADADIGVVAAFGQILSEEDLNVPRLGCVNIHASLLPRYRGSSPIQQAILDGMTVTGVTIMRMDAGVDTGDILLQEECPIAKDETAGGLFDKLSALGASLIVKALPMIEAGELTPVKQDETQVTLTHPIGKEMGLIRWHQSAESIERQIRAASPWPSAFTRLPDGRLIKIWQAEAWKLTVSGEADGGRIDPADRCVEWPDNGEAVPGRVLTVENGKSFFVACGSGCLRVLAVQLEGKKRMSVHDFLLGFQAEAGLLFV